MQKFRIKNLQLLVATDVAARGLDVDDLTHVINYGLPDDIESYTHRRGRTGRAGKTGISISICHVREKGKIKEIERVINKKFEKGEMPSGKEICAKQLFNLVDQIEKVKVNEEEIAELMPQIYRKLEWLDKEDIIKRMVSLEFNRMIDYYKDADEIETIDEKSSRKDREGGRKRKAEEGFVRFFINFGKTDGLYTNQSPDRPDRPDGKILILRSGREGSPPGRKVHEQLRSGRPADCCGRSPGKRRGQREGERAETPQHRPETLRTGQRKAGQAIIRR